jgi:hypothetical protein
MPEIPSLPSSVLQTTQIDRIQDLQQRQANVDQKVAGHQFSQRVSEKRNQVQLTDRVESDALSADGRTGGGRGDSPEEEPQAEKKDAIPAEPGLGESIDLKA